METVIIVLPILAKAIEAGLEIKDMIDADRDKKGILEEVGHKIQNVNTVLEIISKRRSNTSIDTSIMNSVLKGLHGLGEEVKRIKNMGRFMYLLQRKDCQDKLHKSIGSVQFYLMSVNVNQGNEIKLDTQEIKLQNEEIKKILAQQAISDNGEFEKLLEKERQQAEELRRQLEAKELKLLELQSMGLGTPDELKQALEQAKQVLNDTEDAKNRLEAAYLEDVIQMLQASETPSRAFLVPDCPISLEPLHDPVIIDCDCRSTVSRSSFLTWQHHVKESHIHGGPPKCPVCGCELYSLRLAPNVALREMMETNVDPSPPVSRVPDPSPSESHAPTVLAATSPRHEPQQSQPSYPDDEQAKEKKETKHVTKTQVLNDIVFKPDVAQAPDTLLEEDQSPSRTLSSLSQTLMIGNLFPPPPLQDEEEAAVVFVPTHVSQSKSPSDGGGNYDTSGHGLGGNRFPPAGGEGGQPHDEPVTQNKQSCTRRLPRRYYWIIMFLLVVLATAISVPVLMNYNHTTSPSGSPLTSTPGSPPKRPTSRPIEQPTPSPTKRPTPSPTKQPLFFNQVGSHLDGEAADDNFGTSVALSSDGTRLVIGATHNDGNGDGAGHVRVYDWSGSQWTQMGSDLDGEGANDGFGGSVALSSDGTRVAIGASRNNGNGEWAGHVRVYDWTGSQWTQVGSDLDGEAACDLSGWSVAMSSDGTRLAIGATDNSDNISDAGHVRVYDWTGSQWTQVGSDLDGDTAEAWSGYSVALSWDGTRVAIGAIFGNVDGNGLVRVYEWTGSQWTKVGSDLIGEAANGWFGYSVALSADGTRVAIGVPEIESVRVGTGHVLVYGWTGSQWMQVGSNLEGERADDGFGGSLALSSDGTRVAIGATGNDGNGDGVGHVRVYDWTGSQWTQVGSDLDGEAADDAFGASVALSADGTRVAIGAGGNAGNGVDAGHVRVYDMTSLNSPTKQATPSPTIRLTIIPTKQPIAFNQVGSDLDGDAANDEFGSSVALSANGTRVAIGAPSLINGTSIESGYVRVYDWTGIEWTQVGSDLDGEAADDGFGVSVALSADGTRVAIGSWYNDGNGESAGHTRVYDWTGSQWTQVGSDLDGEAAGDHFGSSVALSAKGTRVAIGATLNDGNGDDAGHVRVYDWTGSQWTQVGSDLDGEADGDWFGWSLALSSNGTRVAIGTPYNNLNGYGAGHARVYDWTGSQWTQVGSDFDGEAANGWFGHSVALSSDGTRLAIGAPEIELFSGTGHVRVYDWTGSQWMQVGSYLYGEAAEDLFGYSVALSSNGTRVAIGATNGNDDSNGHVRVYDWTGSQWTKVGSDLIGEAAFDNFGTSVALSSDGTRLAVGAIGNDGNGDDAGHVRVYDWTGSQWMQVGSNLEGERANEVFGSSVALSWDGTRAAIGATDRDDNGFGAGRVRLYDLTF